MANILKLPDTRWGAFVGHLIISLAILVGLYVLIAYVMFPGALFDAAGGIDGLKIVAGVDIVLGPLLTLIIYNIAKPRKELYRDLFIIGTVQVLALGAGMALVYKSRPAAVTYVFDAFHTTKTSEFVAADQPLPKGLNWFTPQYYYLDLPEDNSVTLQLMAQYEFAGEAPRLRSDLYLPLKPLKEQQASMLKALRVSEEKLPSVDPSCIFRDVRTAFDAVFLCFDTKDFGFSYPKEPATN